MRLCEKCLQIVSEPEVCVCQMLDKMFKSVEYQKFDWIMDYGAISEVTN